MSYPERPEMLPATQSRSVTLRAADQADLPAVIEGAGDQARAAFLEFFIATIRNPNTRAAYARAVRDFFSWCELRGFQLVDVEPIVVGLYIEEHPGSPATVKQHLAAIRMLFDYFVSQQVLASNPSSTVKGPRHVVKKGKTPVISAEDVKALLKSVSGERLSEKRDRAMIATMLFSFARVGAVVQMTRADYVQRGKVHWLRLHEKGSKHHEVPAHHLSVEYLDYYLDAAGELDKKAPLFQSINPRGQLTGRAINRKNTRDMIVRRCRQAGISGHLHAPFASSRWDHHLHGKRRNARARPGDSRPRVTPDNETLRPHLGYRQSE